MKIIFYDINLLNQKKYIGDIVNYYIDNTDVDVIILYDEFDKTGFEFFKDKQCQLIHNNAFTYSGIKKLLKKNNPELFMVNAQRLSDSAFVTVAKTIGIETGMIQHGMYIPFMQRERFYLIKKVFKTLKFFMYSQVIAKAIDLNGIEVFKKYLKTFVKGEVYKKAIDFTDKVNTDFVLVYGEYWKEYHRDIFGYQLEQQDVIGYHELNKLTLILSKPFEEDSVCYIAQTLVEDGRLNRNEMINFLTSLSEVAKKTKVYIKLHPRSDKELYTDSKFILLETDIPNAGCFLGHYSSLLALVGGLKRKLILFEFDEHEIPNYFKNISYTTSNRSDFLKLIYDRTLTIKADTKDIDFYFERGYSTENVVDKITSNIGKR